MPWCILDFVGVICGGRVVRNHDICILSNLICAHCILNHEEAHCWWRGEIWSHFFPGVFLRERIYARPGNEKSVVNRNPFSCRNIPMQCPPEVGGNPLLPAKGQSGEQPFSNLPRMWGEDASLERSYLCCRSYIGRCSNRTTMAEANRLGAFKPENVDEHQRCPFFEELLALVLQNSPMSTASDNENCMVKLVDQSGSRPGQCYRSSVMLRMPWSVSFLRPQLCLHIGSYKWLRHVLAVCSYNYICIFACLLVVLSRGLPLIDLCICIAYVPSI